MWRAEATCVLVIGAHAVECAEWPRALARPPARSRKRPIEIAATEAPEVAMQRAVAEMACAFAAESATGRSSSRRLKVLVCDRWMGLITIPWSQALTALSQQERFVRSQLEAAGFETTDSDTVRMDDASAFGHPRVAVAYPAPLMEVIASAASLMQARLESVLPLEVVAALAVCSLNGRCAHTLAILAGTRLRFMALAPSGLSAGRWVVEPRLLDDRTAMLQTLWRRQQLRDPALAEQVQLPVLDLGSSASPDVPMASTEVAVVAWPQEHDDALSPSLRAALASDMASSLNGAKYSPRRNPTAWLVSVVCFGIAVALGARALSLSNEAQALEGSVETQTRVRAQTPPPKWTREELGRIRSVNAAIRELNLPIADVLRALQPPQDSRVALLGIVVEPSSATADGTGVTLKLNAEASSGAEMARYVRTLAARPALTRAYLVSHSVDESGAARPYRFTVEIAWQE